MTNKIKYYIIAAIIFWIMGFVLTVTSLNRTESVTQQIPKKQIVYQYPDDDYEGDLEDASPEDVAHV